MPGRRAAVDIGGNDIEILIDAVGASGIGVVAVVIQGIAVAHHARGRVVTSDGEGGARPGGAGYRETDRHPTTDHRDAAHGQGLQAIRRVDGEGAALGQGRGIRVGAVAEVFFVDGEFAAFDVQAANRDRVIVVMNIQHKVGSAGVAVGIGQGVGEGFGAVATRVQGFEVGVAGVQGVGVCAVCVEHQGAVFTGESAANHWAARGSDRNAISALDVVEQHTAGQGHQGFRRGVGVAVIERLGHVVGDVDVQGTGGSIAIAVAGHHGEVFAEVVGAVTGRMGFIVVEGVAVTHNPRGRVVAGDGQNVAQRGGDRLREACGNATADHVNPSDAEAAQPIRSGHAERAGLGQCPRVGGRTVGQVGLIEGQFAPGHRQAGEGDRIVRHIRNNPYHRKNTCNTCNACTVVRVTGQPFQGKLGNTVEASGRKTNSRIDPPTHLFKHDERVATAQCTRCAS